MLIYTFIKCKTKGKIRKKIENHQTALRFKFIYFGIEIFSYLIQIFIFCFGTTRLFISFLSSLTCLTSSHECLIQLIYKLYKQSISSYIVSIKTILSLMFSLNFYSFSNYLNNYLGCPTTGYYGFNCSIPCPYVNCRYCDIKTGTCQGCKPGYRGHRCELRNKTILHLTNLRLLSQTSTNQ